MYRPRRKSLWRTLPRRAWAGLMLAGYLAAAVGFPVPAAPRPDGAGRSPCAGGSCGCSAEARANGTCCCAGAKARPESAPETPCCAAPPRGPEACPHCSARARADLPPCCAQGTGGGCCGACQRQGHPARTEGETRPPAPAQGAAWRWVAGISALRCRGLATVWVSSGWVPPPPEPPAWAPCRAHGGWLADPGDRAA